MKNVIAAGMILLAGALTLIGSQAGLDGVILVAHDATSSSSNSIWETLGFISNILAPIIGAVITAMIWIHRRVRELEDDLNDLDKSVFGDERNELNEGVLREVANINGRLDKIQDSIDDVREENEKLRRVQRQEVNGEIDEKNRFED